MPRQSFGSLTILKKTALHYEHPSRILFFPKPLCLIPFEPSQP